MTVFAVCYLLALGSIVTGLAAPPHRIAGLWWSSLVVVLLLSGVVLAVGRL